MRNLNKNGLLFSDVVDTSPEIKLLVSLKHALAFAWPERCTDAMSAEAFQIVVQRGPKTPH